MFRTIVIAITCLVLASCHRYHAPSWFLNTHVNYQLKLPKDIFDTDPEAAAALQQPNTPVADLKMGLYARENKPTSDYLRDATGRELLAFNEQHHDQLMPLENVCAEGTRIPYQGTDDSYGVKKPVTIHRFPALTAGEHSGVKLYNCQYYLMVWKNKSG